MTTPEVSHGRGGAGNINKDDTKYVDGEVVRVGVVGSHGDGAFSTGRGGSGNIGDVGTKHAPTRADKDYVPEAAVRPSTDNQDHHTGRGGAGNTKKASPPANADNKESTSSAAKSLVDKLKSKIMSFLKK